MAQLSANGAPCVKGRIRIPRIGAWTADLVVNDTDPDNYSGQIQIVFAGGRITMIGTAARYNAQYGVVMLRVFGGGGGLGELIPPKAYQTSTLQVILSDICSAAGETLSGICDPPTLATGFPFWNRFQMTAGRAIQAVLEDLGVSWRVNTDGTIYVGPETYPASSMTNFVVIDQAPQEAWMEIDAEIPNVLPGQTLQGEPVSRVEHHFDEGKLRSHIWFEVLDA